MVAKLNPTKTACISYIKIFQNPIMYYFGLLFQVVLSISFPLLCHCLLQLTKVTFFLELLDTDRLPEAGAQFSWPASPRCSEFPMGRSKWDPFPEAVRVLWACRGTRAGPLDLPGCSCFNLWATGFFPSKIELMLLCISWIVMRTQEIHFVLFLLHLTVILQEIYLDLSLNMRRGYGASIVA